MKKLTKAILVLSLALATGCVSGPKVDNAPVAALDLNRYLGEWYEIARFDHSFERGVEQTKANYTQNADGTIMVNCLKPRSPNFSQRRNGVATMRASSSGCGKEKMRRPDLGQNNVGYFRNRVV